MRHGWPAISERGQVESVPVCGDGDDPLYANRSFIGHSTGAAGVRTLRLPRRTSVFELAPPHREWTDVSEVSGDLPKHRTALFFLGSMKEWESTVMART